MTALKMSMIIKLGIDDFLTTFYMNKVFITLQKLWSTHKFAFSNFLINFSLPGIYHMNFCVAYF